jgi:SAM-dependent methyltransferase
MTGYSELLAEVYDEVYVRGVGKDYQTEAAGLTALIRGRAPHAASLLDVACGSGEHLVYLRDSFDHVEGAELSQAMCRIAESKLPDVPIYVADMRSLDLGRTFDAVTCLFSAIGYVADTAELDASVARMAAHLNPGGVLVVEPWFTPDQWMDGHVSHTLAESPERIISRMSYSGRRGKIATTTMHYLVGEKGVGVRSFSEEHALALFTDAEYRAAFDAAGLTGFETIAGWRQGRPRLVAVMA